MRGAFRILATGELDTSNLALCVVSASDDAFHSELGFHEALQQAIAQGAVLYEIDTNDDPYTEYHQEDEIIEFLGTSMTYKEYWAMFPEEKIEQPVPDWQARILLQVSSPVVRLRSPTLDRYLVAETGPDFGAGATSMAFFIALMSVAAQLDATSVDDELPLLQPAYIRPVHASQAAVLQPGFEWQLGDETTLEAADYPPTSLRDWAWAWPRTYGPVYFNLYVHRTAEQLIKWLAQVFFYRYRLAQGVLVQGEKSGSFADGYQQIQPHANAYQLHEHLPGWGQLFFNTGVITFIRTYQSPSIIQQAFDASLLAAIRAGELGELSWDVLDGDYVAFQATGDGLASLQHYLDPKCDEAQLRAGWSVQFVRHQVDAHMAENWDQVTEAVGRHFHRPSQPFDLTFDLLAWLRTTPISELPRAVQVAVSRQVYNDTEQERQHLHLANTRILWSWRLVQPTD